MSYAIDSFFKFDHLSDLFIHTSSIFILVTTCTRSTKTKKIYILQLINLEHLGKIALKWMLIKLEGAYTSIKCLS